MDTTLLPVKGARERESERESIAFTSGKSNLCAKQAPRNDGHSHDSIECDVHVEHINDNNKTCNTNPVIYQRYFSNLNNKSKN